ncbi:hypothetical protein DFR58_1283 [Anaerobacterium chartisolvens]|uniref:Uncharacterized protein n=1 Tax=Anaerobacterium chartisolvens TaxID=1297424 RepID=A0A369ASR8_9FIRM|nr:hypothetical protein [Anaerobacterium chartisolvens]RCX10504.1 hypothetical protein DFR58_1283 [Anaerobacterium chartisolvens]
MSANESYKAYLEFLRSNLDTVMEGREIEYQCPFCNTSEKIKILKQDTARCLRCGNEFKVEIRFHID